MVPGNVFVFYVQLLKHCPVDDLSLSTKRSVKENSKARQNIGVVHLALLFYIICDISCHC